MTYTTDDYRNAPSGEGPLAGQWADKPHRLVYDLVNVLECNGRGPKIVGNWSPEWPTTPGRYWCHGYPFTDCKEAVLVMVEMKLIGNPEKPWPSYTAHGQFVWPKTAGNVVFCPVVVPEVPCSNAE